MFREGSEIQPQLRKQMNKLLLLWLLATSAMVASATPVSYSGHTSSGSANDPITGGQFTYDTGLNFDYEIRLFPYGDGQFITIFVYPRNNPGMVERFTIGAGMPLAQSPGNLPIGVEIPSSMDGVLGDNTIAYGAINSSIYSPTSTGLGYIKILGYTPGTLLSGIDTSLAVEMRQITTGTDGLPSVSDATLWYNYTTIPVSAPTPELGSAVLLIIGFVCLVILRHRKIRTE